MAEFRLLPTAALTEPEHPARTTMDDDRMNSLVVSIRALGVLEPLHVKPVPGDLFEVVAGHRRLRAARVAGVSELPCIVLESDALAEAVKIHENLEREDLSPADEAIFYAELYESHGSDVDAVAELVKRSRDHVENRLNLLRGDKHVFAALAGGKISIGVARELNMIAAEDDRLFHLDYAVRTGVTVETARQWRVSANTRASFSSPAPAEVTSTPATTTEDPAAAASERRMFAAAAPWELDTSKDLRPCKLCTEEHPAWQMLKVHVCAACAETVLPRILAAFQGREG